MSRPRFPCVMGNNPLYRPERALLHPAWLLAMTVMGLNDHVLKHAGVLPGALTGKLSDFAGLFAAPALLAVLVRARSRTALVLCAIAVGLGFTAIELSPAAADVTIGALALVGVHWQLWSDPTDLIALVMLVPSVAVLGPAMIVTEGSGPHDASLGERALRVVAGVAGLVLCTATSPARPPVAPANNYVASAFLYNGSGHDVTALVSPLVASVSASASGEAGEAGAPRTVPLAPEGMTPLWIHQNGAGEESRTTYAVRIEIIDSIASAADCGPRQGSPCRTRARVTWTLGAPAARVIRQSSDLASQDGALVYRSPERLEITGPVHVVPE